MLTLKLIQPNCGRVVSSLPDDRRSIISICPSTKSPSSTPCPPKDPKSLRRPVSELSQLEDTQEEDAALESDEDQEYPLLESCKIKKRVVVPGITIERAWWDREDPCETCLLSFLGLGCLVLIGLFSFLVHASVGSDTSDLWNSTSTTGTSPVSPTSASYNKGVNHESPKGKSFWGQLVDFAWPIAATVLPLFVMLLLASSPIHVIVRCGGYWGLALFAFPGFPIVPCCIFACLACLADVVGRWDNVVSQFDIDTQGRQPRPGPLKTVRFADQQEPPAKLGRKQKIKRWFR
jgi:hypothetical protein